MAYTVSSGITSNGIILYSDSIIVLDGGTTNNTTINTRGSMHISSGGTANSTTVSSGYISIFSGGTANSTTVDGSGSVFVGGTANSTTVNGGGSMFVSGTANTTTISSGGSMFVSSGGVANSTTVSSGYISVFSGGTANSTIVYSGSMFVFSGGAASTTTVSGGNLTISSGGTATDIVWTPCVGNVYVENGAHVTFVSEYLGVYYGSNNQLLSNEKTMNGKILYKDELIVMSGGTADNTTVILNGNMFVSNGGMANNTTIRGGKLTVSNGGSANNTFFDTVGSMFIFNGGTANITTVNGGSMFVFNSGTANSTTVWRGNLTISNGGTANSTTVNGGSMFVCGTANNTIVNTGGSMIVTSGGTATGIVENGGFVDVESGVQISFVSNFLSGLLLTTEATAHSGTSASNLKISGGIFHVFSGGNVNKTTVCENGSLILSGGIANDTIVYEKGNLTILSDGIVDSVKIYAGGKVSISSGGSITGKMSFLAGSIFTVENGAVINFDLSKTTPNAKALLNNWSLIQGVPDFTVTVRDDQESGIYCLASVADEFDGTITVQNTLGELLGKLTLGQKATIGDTNYTLTVADGSLIITVGTVSPVAPSGLMPLIDGRNVALLWNESTDDLSVVKEYVVTYSCDGQVFTARTAIPHYVLNNANYGSYSWSVQAVDFAGNKSAIAVGSTFTVSGFKPYIVEYSTDSFEHILHLEVNSDALDSLRLPTGIYQTRTRAANSADWTIGDIIVSSIDKSPMLVKSDADGNADVFFANACGVWTSRYEAKHNGALGGWIGTRETVHLSGKNKLVDIFEGSTDANILFMTDDSNGDALFVDDIYTALPGTLTEQQARIARIDEIRAGAGDDIVDMTSQRFEYAGEGLTIHGGDGDDVIWANKGDNMFFGDAGNDRIVGASGNEVIVGGIGNDSMHGGGGNDVFTFCDNWGEDTVEQLANGTVTLWFASGDESKWNPGTLIYTDGDNSVTVSGVSADKIELKFGGDGKDAAQFVSLSGAGAFDAITSQRIFEESDKGVLAGL